MPSFWREISDVVVKHTIGFRLEMLAGEGVVLNDRLNELEARMTSAESDVDALNALYNELDQWSNQVAEDLETLRQHASSGNVSAADVAARITPIINRLKAAGQNGQLDGQNSDPSTTTDPSNSPTADSPVVTPAPDAPTEVPTSDPTVNPVDIPADSQAGSSANDAEAQGTVGSPAVDPNAIPQPLDTSSNAAPEPASTTPAQSPDSTTQVSSSDSANTNDYREQY